MSELQLKSRIIDINAVTVDGITETRFQGFYQ